MFDFDATLPLMALQFVLLAIILNAIFYKPLNKALDERADYIRQNEGGGKKQLAEAKELAAKYQQQLAQARKESQDIVAQAQAEAKQLATEAVAEAQKEAIAKKEAAAQEIEQERQEALKTLEQQVDTLSRQILEKLLGPELVK
ncbi:F0F1 ATP synthase subunit B' [Cyanothece sp. BG0011]|uniref:F0F1 ATP synthase subunit B' n=1 Tax=Cyanothece sp. BG0011 TaxID=2082950 RepID=UPI000D1DD1D2|nr:F0F1 ATP synthase subunit B' [Cyanothece sp. BG0011]